MEHAIKGKLAKGNIKNEIRQKAHIIVSPPYDIMASCGVSAPNLQALPSWQDLPQVVRQFMATAPTSKDLQSLAQQVITLVKALLRMSTRSSLHHHHRHLDTKFSCQLAITQFSGMWVGLR
ncbi:hypothetical protein E2C01_019343 [Portunus trituberculatus]|uniref:Uncharacterized protein n=1 Tax=Portunus trituberculatus TaxID=210409 RepID=A0A5B7DYM0_PORTR|nr:hypothetical protein [Portunus trituberculatus]